jgi:hypothetical protein
VERSIRSILISGITFVGGLYFVLEFLLPASALKAIGVLEAHEAIINGFITVGSMALALGVVNIVMVHGTRIMYLRRDWLYSIVLVLGMVVMGVISFWDWYNSLRSSLPQTRAAVLADFSLDIAAQLKNESHVGTLPVDERLDYLKEAVISLIDDTTESTASMLSDAEYQKFREKCRVDLEDISVVKADTVKSLAALSEHIRSYGAIVSQVLRDQGSRSLIGSSHKFLVEGLFNSLGAAMFSLLSVYIAAAAYRAFRIRTFESGLMMVSAVVVILGQTSFGVYLWSGMPDMRQWLLEVPNAAAFRAIKVGSSVAALVMAFRMWLSIESDSFSRTNDRAP